MVYLITGSSGFIGFHTVKKLLEQGEKVIGIDNENDYYDVSLKEARRKILETFKNFSFYKGSIENNSILIEIFEKENIQYVIHLAAQAGVRYSLVNPYAYIQTNIEGFHNLIELAKKWEIKKFVYASSASVYGNNKKIPFTVGDKTDEPLSLYGATKKSNELIAHSYSFYFGLPTIGLRFFNVYGPWGRPDGAFFIFTDGILNQKEIDIFNNGETTRNFTYIDDIVEGIIKSVNYKTNYEIFNLGNPNSICLNDMVKYIEEKCGQKAKKNYLPADKADIPESGVDIKHTIRCLNWKPSTHIKEGIAGLVERYKTFYLF